MILYFQNSIDDAAFSYHKLYRFCIPAYCAKTKHATSCAISAIFGHADGSLATPRVLPRLTKLHHGRRHRYQSYFMEVIVVRYDLFLFSLEKYIRQ